jgi:hypothetical protein
LVEADVLRARRAADGEHTAAAEAQVGDREHLRPDAHGVGGQAQAHAAEPQPPQVVADEVVDHPPPLVRREDSLALERLGAGVVRRDDGVAEGGGGGAAVFLVVAVVDHRGVGREAGQVGRDRLAALRSMRRMAPCLLDHRAAEGAREKGPDAASSN